jgi:hypothetical protein
MIKICPSPKEERMTTLPTYDILKRRDDGTLAWVEAVPDLDTANAHIKELHNKSGEEYVVFDQKAQELVVTNPIP